MSQIAVLQSAEIFERLKKIKLNIIQIKRIFQKAEEQQRNQHNIQKTKNPKHKIQANHKQKEIKASIDIKCCKQDVSIKSKGCPQRQWFPQELLCFKRKTLVSTTFSCVSNTTEHLLSKYNRNTICIIFEVALQSQLTSEPKILEE